MDMAQVVGDNLYRLRTAANVSLAPLANTVLVKNYKDGAGGEIIDFKRNDVTFLSIASIPISCDLLRVLEIEHRVENRLLREPWRESTPTGRFDQRQLLRANRTPKTHYAGSCWVMQWNEPPPVKMAFEDSPTTLRPGNSGASAFTASSPLPE